MPEGDAKFTVVDVDDISHVAAVVMANTDKHINMAYESTCNEKLSFKEMADKLSHG